MEKLPYYIRIEILSYLRIEIIDNFLGCFGRFKEDYSRKLFVVRRNIFVHFCHNFDGKGIPKTITHLRVMMCPKFECPNLPNSLSNLEVHWCSKFDGSRYPNSLSHLKVVVYPNFDGSRYPKSYLLSQFVNKIIF